MGIFSFGKKDDAAPRRRGAAEAGSGWRSNQNTRVERRSRRTDRTGDAEAMLLDPTLPEKQRARRRLVGAIALVVAAIVILPMVLDSHPKPVTSDIAIDIPSRPAIAQHKADARDDGADATAATAGIAGLAPGADATGASATTATAGKTTAPATQSAQSTAPTPTAKTAQTSPPARAQKPEAPAAKTAAATGNSAATKAANGTTNPPAATDTGTPAAPAGARYAVQLGAFANDATARNWVTKLKAAGVPAYTELRKEADGSTRTLLRAGPFADREAATDAIAKVRGAGLMAGTHGAE